MEEKKISRKIKAKFEADSTRKPRGKNEESPKDKVTPKKLKLLVTVVSRKKTEFYVDLLQGFEVNMQLCLSAEGTATDETRHLLGLEDANRTVILSLIREDRARDALCALEEKFRVIRGGKGIAYTIPLTGVIGVAIYQFLSNNRTVVNTNTATSEEK